MKRLFGGLPQVDVPSPHRIGLSRNEPFQMPKTVDYHEEANLLEEEILNDVGRAFPPFLRIELYVQQVVRYPAPCGKLR
jgi:hypothetical protein